MRSNWKYLPGAVAGAIYFSVIGVVVLADEALQRLTGASNDQTEGSPS